MSTIYLSSTYEDLKAYRKAVSMALRKSGHYVSAMEEYVATDSRPVDKCLNDVEKADLYVGLFGFYYGYVPPSEHNNPEGLSITELELREAERLGKPCLVFVVSDKTPWPPEFIDSLSGQPINRLRDYLLKEKTVSFFSSPDNLATLVVVAVTKHIEDQKKVERTTTSIPSEPTEADERDSANSLENIRSLVPNIFYGRTEDMEVLERFLADDRKCLLTVFGRKGSGKTATVCKVLEKTIENGQSSHSANRPTIDGLVFIETRDSHLVSWSEISTEIQRVLTNKEQVKWETQAQVQEISLPKKIEKLLKIISRRRIVLFIDPFDPMVDPGTENIRDPELSQVLQILLETVGHRMKIILTVESPLKDLSMVHSSRQEFINLKDGLHLSTVEKMLRDLDHDGSIGFKGADLGILQEVCTRLRGNPLSLVKLTTLLRVNPSVKLNDFLHHTQDLLPQKILDELIGQAFRSLDTYSRMIVQGIAISGRPLPRNAVEFILRPYIPKAVIPRVLDSLVNRRFINKSGDGFSLDQYERQYILSTIPTTPEDFLQNSRDSVKQTFTLGNLRSLAGVYYRNNRVPADQCTSLRDLHSYFAELELWVEARAFEDAAHVLRKIDDWLTQTRHYEIGATLYEQLEHSGLQDKSKHRQVEKLGRFYHKLGKLDKAIDNYQKGLHYAQQTGDREAEWSSLSNLGICYEESGYLELAIRYCEKSFELARELQSMEREAHVLNTLSDCWGHIGNISKAIQFCEQTLSLVEKTESGWQEALALANLGYHFGERGDFQEAEEYSQRACQLSDLINKPLGKVIALINLGEMRLAQRNFSQAAEFFSEATQLSDILNRARLQQKSRVGLAFSQLLQGKRKLAKDGIQEACEYEIPDFDFCALSLKGVIAFIQGEQALATDSFRKSLHHAESILKRTPSFYSAWFGKGVAHTGLSILQGDDSHSRLAKEAFQKGRYISSNPGIIHKTQLLLECLKDTAPTQQLRSNIQEIAKEAS